MRRAELDPTGIGDVQCVVIEDIGHTVGAIVPGVDTISQEGLACYRGIKFNMFFSRVRERGPGKEPGLVRQCYERCGTAAARPAAEL